MIKPDLITIRGQIHISEYCKTCAIDLSDRPARLRRKIPSAGYFIANGHMTQINGAGRGQGRSLINDTAEDQIITRRKGHRASVNIHPATETIGRVGQGHVLTGSLDAGCFSHLERTIATHPARSGNLKSGA